MSLQVTGLVGIASLLVLIFARVPVGVAMGLVGFLGYASIDGFDRALRVLGQTPYDVATTYTLSVVPLFVFMGDLALRSGMSAKLYKAARSIFHGVPGGQALATIGACAGFGAVCGSSVATAAIMTRVAIPEMREAGYDDRLSTGSVAAGGSLGILMPPSIPLVIYGLIAEQSVQRLFAAGLIPGLMLAGLYMLAAVATVMVFPAWAPHSGERLTLRQRLWAATGIWDVAVLIGITIGGIYAGLLTPTEAAAVGAFGAMVLGFTFGELTWRKVMEGLSDSIRTTGMLFLIVMCAMVFSYFIVQTQLPKLLVETAQSYHLSPIALMLALIVFYIILGCFMDGLGMTLITVPVFLPLVVASGFDPVWFGVILVVVIELGLIHPPVGMNIFVIQAQIPDVPILKVYQGILPFLIPPMLLLALLLFVPGIALWLPNLLYR